MLHVSTLAPAALLACLAGCGPVPLDEAERLCVDQARLAEKPRSSVELGYGSGGRVRAALDVEITSDYLAGRDPSAVFNACVQNRSGQFPSRALIDMPGWRV